MAKIRRYGDRSDVVISTWCIPAPCPQRAVEGLGDSAGIPRLGVGRGTRIENAILDKNARVGEGCILSPEGKPENLDHPQYYIRDGILVVPKNGVIPHHTVV